MTLYNIINSIQGIALTQPNVRTADNGSIYDKLDNNPAIQYGVVFLSQTSHREDEQFDYYGFNIFYIDRLDDTMENNRLQIQSIGKEVLSNTIRTFCNTYDVDMPTLRYQPFTQKFDDECAGVYVSLELEIMKDYICDETYDEPVPVPPLIIRNQTKSIDVIENGHYTVGYDAGYTGLEKVNININVPGAILQSTAFTANGSYIQEDGYAWSEVDVNVDTQASYDEGYADGYNSGHEAGYNEGYSIGHGHGIAEQKAKLVSTAITANGTYTREDGFNSVSVNVSIPEPEPVIPDYTKSEDLHLPYAASPAGFPEYDMPIVFRCSTDGKIILSDNDDAPRPGWYNVIDKDGNNMTVLYNSREEETYVTGPFISGDIVPLWFKPTTDYVGAAAFDGSDAISICMPADINSLDWQAFTGEYDSITSYAMTAPVLVSSTVFHSTVPGVLRVPSGATGYDAWLTQLGENWTIEYFQYNEPPTPEPYQINLYLSRNAMYCSAPMIRQEVYYYDVERWGHTIPVFFQNGNGGFSENHPNDILKELHIPDTVQVIGGHSFEKCTNLQKVYFGDHRYSLLPYQHHYGLGQDGGMFYDCGKLNEIFCYCEEAPILHTGIFGNFENVSPTGILHYPSGCDYSTWINALPSGWTAIADL